MASINELDQLLKEMADAPVPSIEQIKTRCDIAEEDLEVLLMTEIAWIEL